MPSAHHVPSYSSVLPNSWLTRGSRWRLRFCAALVGVIVFAGVGFADWLMLDARLSPFHLMLGSDAVAALLAAGFALKLMADIYDRRQLVLRRLEMIAETNHHIRNALELIQFSAQTTQNKEVIDNISDGVDRIQWVLRELIGDGDDESLASRPSAGPRQ